jgi:hypothetical protein
MKPKSNEKYENERKIIIMKYEIMATTIKIII